MVWWLAGAEEGPIACIDPVYPRSHENGILTMWFSLDMVEHFTNECDQIEKEPVDWPSLSRSKVSPHQTHLSRKNPPNIGMSCSRDLAASESQ